jgi:putative ABC transport system permease protein
MVIILLALGIATTSLLLTAIDRLLLHPINAPHSESLVRAATMEPKGLVYARFPYVVYADVNHQALTLSSTAADADVDVGVSLGGLPEPAVAHMISASYFAVLGIPALSGRTLISADDRGDGTAVVLSFGFWQRHFGGSPSVLGRKLFIDAQPFVVVGVMPRGFFGASLDSPADLWIPLASQARISTVPLDSPQPDRSFEIIARLKEGVPLSKAQAEFARTFANVMAEHPELGRGEPRDELGTLETIARRVTWNQDQISKVLLLLLGAVGLTFAILCANVAGLFLVRAAGHERETAVRISLGATPAQLLLERVSESLVLALLGVVGGLALAWAGSPILLRFVPIGAGPLPISLRPGLNVSAVSVAIAVVLSILFGGAVAWHGTRQNVFAALRSGTATSRLGWLGKSLVLVQVGLDL